MVIQSTRKGNSVYDEMKSRVFALYTVERQSAYEAYTADDELNEVLKISEDDYNFNLLKLDELAAIAGKADFIQRLFVEQKIYIEQMDISEKSKVEAILTSACMVKNFGVFLVNRKTSPRELYLLVRAMIGVNPIEYLFYEKLIMTDFKHLMRLLKTFEVSPNEQAKQYVKTENN